MAAAAAPVAAAPKKKPLREGFGWLSSMFVSVKAAELRFTERSLKNSEGTVKQDGLHINDTDDIFA